MKNKVSIIGAGLVGSLLALTLRREGFDVDVYEKRTDPRLADLQEGRSINLALSDRGIRPLQDAGVFEEISKTLVPMHGRMMHNHAGELTFQSYGSESQFINSVSRAHLNIKLIEAASDAGVQFFFEKKCSEVDLEAGILTFSDGTNVASEVIFGADGAFSAVRKRMEQTDRFSYSQYYIEHGYKELSIPPKNGGFSLEPNYLHIWPRGNFMLIALPNNDRSFTCTLFLPFEGENSFQNLSNKDQVNAFFQREFKDAKKLLPDLTDQFFENPTGSMVTTKANPWNRGKCVLIGDAAHAIVPFYGQGMNAGFEDVTILQQLGKKTGWNWDELLPAFSKERKRDADAISSLALNNFEEMRDHVANPDFLRRKKIEAELQKRFPDQWLPLYSMVTFSHLPYSEALRLGEIQADIMDNVLRENSDSPDYSAIVEKFNALKQVD